jgi:hypothetical protein
MKSRSLIALTVLVIALVAFVGLFYVSGALLSAADNRAQEIETRARALDRAAQTQRVHAAVAETADERAAIDGIVNIDIVSTAQLLEDTGGRAGANMKVTNAAPGTGTTALAGGDTLRPMLFTLAGDGSLSALLKAVQLYERMPLAARVTQLQFTRTPESGAAKPWHLDLNLQVLATTPSL